MVNAETNNVLLSLQYINAEKPSAFRTRTNAREFARRSESGKISELEREYLEKTYRALTHPGLDVLIRRGEVTFAIVKPNAYQAKHMELQEGLPRSVKDDMAADILRREILAEDERGMGDIVLELPIQFTESQIRRFYSHLPQPVLERVVKHMTDGPSTVYLIRHYVRDGRIFRKDIKRVKSDAVNFWRQRIGATKPEEASLSTIRGRYAKSVANNLVHGSDSKESVIIEKNHVASAIEEILERATASILDPQDKDVLSL